MHKRILSLILAIVFCSSGAVTAAETQDVAFTYTEDLLFMEIPQVISAGKREQKLTEAPATINVITAADIKAYGAVTIPDALRMVPGVTVVNVAGSQQEVAIRGFSSASSTHVLVMVDGVPANLNIYGNVPWTLMSISIEEIQRIEVVKSPISSLYGAAAYCGVINIITKTPEEINGTVIKAGAGEYKRASGVIMNGAKYGLFEYKASGEWATTNEWMNPDTLLMDNRIYRVNVKAGYKFDENAGLSLTGSYNKNHNYLMTGLNSWDLRIDGELVQMVLEGNFYGLKLKSFYRGIDGIDTDPEPGDTVTRAGEKNYELDVQYNGELLGWNSYIAGATVRNNNVYGKYFVDKKQEQMVYSGYIDDTINIFDFAKLTLGARYDVHPLTKGTFSPRAHIMLMPEKEHLFKLSWSQAFRNPTYIDSYFYSRMNFVSPGIPAYGVPTVNTNVYFDGNRNIKPESIRSIEGEYRFVLKSLNAHVNGFYNSYNNFIRGSKSVNNTVTDFYTIAEYPAGGGFAPKNVVVDVYTTFKNSGEAVSYGGEAGAEAEITSWMKVFGNYSYIQLQYLTDFEDTTTVDEKNAYDESTPKHMINGGVNIKTDLGISGSVSSSWVDRTRVLEITNTGVETLLDVPQYLIWNVSLGYSILNDTLGFNISAYNVFDYRHRQSPQGIDANNPVSSVIGRRVFGSVTYKF